MSVSPCLPALLSAETLSGWNLCRPCTCCHHLCELISESVLLCLEDTVPLESSLPFGS